jgi:nucleoside-diphosphate-sugar epimerase
MKILITGINGFVGNNLVTSLRDSHLLYGLDIISLPKVGVIKTFLWTELNEISQCDIIIHLAGKAHDTKNKTNAQVYFDVNTRLTEKIYDWFLNSNAKKFIFFSSVKAAADRVDCSILTEDILPSPKGPYGESKIAAEDYILSKMASISDSNKDTYILRPCMIHGPGNKGNLNLLYNVIKKGIPYPLGAFENKRSFTSIDNLCYVISQLIEKEVESGIYNVCDDESISTNELISIIAEVTGSPNRIWNWNPQVISYCAKIGTLLHLPLNSERLQKLTENYVVSNAKLKKVLDIKVMTVSAIDGFKKTIKSFEN